MRIEPTDAAALGAVIESDLAAVRRMSSALAALEGSSLGEHQAIVAAYYLHAIYNALENSFDQISRTFENHVKDTTRWHDELLRKMFLNLSPLRPAVLPDGARQHLSELRGFRHVFRHTYDGTLDTTKMLGVWKRWTEAEATVTSALAGFAERLHAVARDSSGSP